MRTKPKPIREHVTEQFVAVRREKKVSHEMLSASSGISPSEIHKIEKGAHEPSMRTWWLLCDGVDTEMQSLLEGFECDPVIDGSLALKRPEMWVSPAASATLQARAIALENARAQYVADRVKDARTHRSVTQRVLAAKAGVSLNMLRRIERAEGSHKITVLSHISAALGIHVHFLLPPPPRPKMMNAPMLKLA
jgi:transcriptional regulator with XRE-family HTH domain